MHSANQLAGVGAEVAALIAEQAFEWLDAPDHASRRTRHPGAIQPAARRRVSSECAEDLRGGKGARGLLTMTVDQKLAIYYWMQLTRTFDERMLAHWKQGRGVGGTFSQRGHEAISVGAAYALGPDDVVSPMHRDLGAFLLRGLTPSEIFSNLLGRETGPTRGRDANLHGISSLEPRHHRFHQPPPAFVTGGAWRGDELSLS